MARAELTREWDVSAERLYQLVTQYEAYPEFVDGVQSTTVERKAPGRARAHFEVRMIKEVDYTLDLTEVPERFEVSWVLAESDFFRKNTGGWKIEPTGRDSCRATYALDVEFSFPVPGLILKRLVQGQLPAMMDAFYERLKS